MVKYLRDKLHDIQSKYTWGTLKENLFVEWLLRTLLEPMYWYLNLKKNIKNFFYWGWELREDRDWDHYYFEHIMYLKFKRMLEHFKDSSRATWSNMDRSDPEYDTDEAKPYKALRICYKILERTENDWYGSGERKVTKLYGNLKLETFPSEKDGFRRVEIKREKECSNNEDEVESISKYYRDIERNVRARDRRILFKLLETRLEFFWD